jgi:uncharacterized membrane protein YkgB
MPTLPPRLDALDAALAGWMQRHGFRLLRVALGLVFVWFGALKLLPGLSPAEPLVVATAEALARLAFFPPPELFVRALGVWEIVIGLGFLARPLLRPAIALLALQMPGTLLPLVLLPELCYTAAPLGLTLTGQYIVKNVVLVAAALVVGGTVRLRTTASTHL